MAPPLFVTPEMDINSPALETTTFTVLVLLVLKSHSVLPTNTTTGPTNITITSRTTTMFFQPFCSLVRTLEVLLMNTLEVLLKKSELGFGELTPSCVLPTIKTTVLATTITTLPMFFQPFCSLFRTLDVLLMNTLEVPRSCVNPRVVLLKMSELGFGELTPSIVLFPGLFLHVLVNTLDALVNKLDVPPPPGQPLLLVCRVYASSSLETGFGELGCGGGCRNFVLGHRGNVLVEVLRSQGDCCDRDENNDKGLLHGCCVKLL